MPSYIFDSSEVKKEITEPQGRESTIWGRLLMALKRAWSLHRPSKEPAAGLDPEVQCQILEPLSGKAARSAKTTRTRKQTLDPVSMRRALELLQQGDRASAAELIQEKMGLDAELAGETVEMLEKLYPAKSGASLRQ